MTTSTPTEAPSREALQRAYQAWVDADRAARNLTAQAQTATERAAQARRYAQDLIDADDRAHGRPALTWPDRQEDTP